jgi:MFS family permease
MSSSPAYPRRWQTLRVLALSLVIIGLDNTILNVALPSLQEHFDASGSTLQWMVDSYLVSFAGLLLTLGTLGDRFGRELALQTGIALFGLASLAVVFVETSTQLIAVRAVMGVGGALIMPARLSIITNIFPREERSKAIGVWAGLIGLGATLTTALLWTPDMPYWPIGLWFFFGALSMGCILGPATGSVMGAVPKEKAGVASAMNDVTRRSESAVKDSIGSADAVAAKLPADQAASLAHSAAVAFTDALGIGLCAAAIAALVAAVVVIRRLPARASYEVHPTPTLDIAVQTAGDPS